MLDNDDPSQLYEWTSWLVLISSCVTPSRTFSRRLSNISSNWVTTCFRPWDQAHSYNSPWWPLQDSTPWTEHLCWLWAFDCVSRLIFCVFYIRMNINLYFPFQRGFCCPLSNSALSKNVTYYITLSKTVCLYKTEAWHQDSKFWI